MDDIAPPSKRLKQATLNFSGCPSKPTKVSEELMCASECSDSCAAVKRSAEMVESKLKTLIILPSAPHQPTDITFPTKRIGDKNRSFQPSWFQTHKWMHYISDTGSGDSVQCFSCLQAKAQGLFHPTRRLEKAFIDGFSNWKNTEKFHEHAKSDQHKEAVMSLIGSQKPITCLLNEVHHLQQEHNSKALKAIFETVVFLAAQGQPFQGHLSNEGNYLELLRLRARDVPALKQWMMRRDSWTSHDVQNEMINLVATKLLRDIAKDIQNSSFFSTLADGSQDINGDEQLSIVYRKVGDNFEITDYFVGFYHLPNSTGSTIASALLDSATRLQLDMNKNRALGFDGASNMAGSVKGARSKIQEQFPKSVYFHCSNHCLDLCLQEVAREEKIIYDALEHVRTVANYVRESGKRLSMYEEVCRELTAIAADDTDFTKIQALCPTRWVVRVRALKCWMKNWKALHLMLERISDDYSFTSDARMKASGFRRDMTKFRIYFGIRLSILLFEECEIFSRKLQGVNSAAVAITTGAEMLIASLESLRSSAIVDRIFEESCQKAIVLGIEEQARRDTRKPLKMDEHPHTQHAFKQVESYRVQFFACIDRMKTSLQDR